MAVVVVILAVAASPAFAQTSTGGGSSSLTVSNVFSFMDSQVETPLISTVSQIMNSLLSYAATPLRSALVLYIALTGILIIRGYTDEVGPALLGRFLKMGLVVWVMTGSSVFQQYVYTFFFTTLPTSLQSAVSQGNGQASNFQASSFDGVWYQAFLAGWVLWEKATTSGSMLHPLTWLGPAFGVVLFWLAAGMSTVVGFVIWLVSRVFLGLTIAVGPILIPLALFQATRAIFEHWISAMLSCVLLQVMTIIMMSVITGTEKQILTSFAATMQSSTTSTVDGMGLLLAGVMFFAVAGFVGLQLPQVATSIAGGVHFHAAPFVSLLWRRTTGGTRNMAAAAGATVGTFTGLRAAGSRAWRHMNPPGGSMSA